MEKKLRGLRLDPHQKQYVPQPLRLGDINTVGKVADILPQIFSMPTADII